MTHDEMITAVVRRYGFEHKVTIAFCNLVEGIESGKIFGGEPLLTEPYLEGTFEEYMNEDFD